MQVAAQAAALLFPCGDQPGPRLLEVTGQLPQLSREPHGLHGDRNLRGKVMQESQIGRRQGLARCPCYKHKVAHLLGLNHERHAH